MKSRLITTLTAFAIPLAVSLLAVPAAALGDVHMDPSFANDGVADVTSSFTSPAALALGGDGAIRAFGMRVDHAFTAAATGLTADGQIDPSFGGSGTGSTDILQTDGFTLGVGTDGGSAVVAVSVFDSSSKRQTIRVARVLPDGRLDPTFGAGGVVDTGVETYSDVSAALMLDGRVVVVTTTPLSQGAVDTGVLVMRFLPDGSPDPTFSGDGRALIQDPQYESTDEGPLVVLPDGDIVIAGGVYRSPGAFQYDVRSVLFRLDADGQLDRSFGVDGFRVGRDNYSFISDLAISPAGRIIAVGNSTAVAHQQPWVLAYDAATGDPVKRFGDRGVVAITDSGFGDLSSVAVESDGTIVAGGEGNTTDYEDGGDNGDFLLVRLTSKGYPDRSFAPGGTVTTDFAQGTDRIADLAIQPSGRIVTLGVHGYFYFRGPNTSYAYVVGYDPGARRPDRDRDGFEDKRDRCRGVVGEIHGCPRLERRVSLRKLGDRGFGGLVRTSVRRCLRDVRVKLIRRRGATTSVVGTDRDLDHGRWEIDAPGRPGHYRATIDRKYLPRVGMCAGARSAALSVSP